MPRRLERTYHGFAAPALATVLVAPAATKFEVVGIGWQGDLAHAQTAYCFWSTAAVSFVGFDQFTMPATKYGEWHDYNGVVLLPGDSLSLWHAAAAGTAFATISYVSVAPI